MNTPQIIYTSEHVIGVYKPSRLLVHTDGVSNEETLVDWVLREFPEIEGVGEPQKLKDGTIAKRHGVVHRLDRDTSGIILFARTQEGFASLKEQFKKRTIQKTYRAFVYGNIKEEEGEIDRPIGRSSKDFRMRSAQRGARGKLREALTTYSVLGRAKDKENKETLTYLDVFPKTGRTHQIRVHMKAVHHPIVCDPLYAKGRPCLFGFTRLALHAFSIDFKDPQGEKMSLEAPLPEDFLHAETLLE